MNYKMKLNLLKLFVLLAVPFATANAADVNMKFGKPTKEEMLMTTYEADPKADAVVLCRLTDVEYTVEFNGYIVDYHEKCRIKVLQPGGERFAKVVVPFNKNVTGANRLDSSHMSLKGLMFDMGSATSAVFNDAAGSMLDNSVGSYTDESIAEIGVKMLLERMDDASLPARNVILPVKLFEGGTTAPPSQNINL